MSDLREQLRDATVAAIKKHNNGIYVDCVKVADDTFPLIEAALTRAKGAVREACAGHQPMIAHTRTAYTWIYCSCGFNRDFDTHTEEPEAWTKHIRSLPDPSVQAYEERIRKEGATQANTDWIERCRDFRKKDAIEFQAQIAERDEKIAHMWLKNKRAHDECIETLADEAKAHQTIHALVTALERIERLEAEADAVIGFVDNPHTKAFRVACKTARAAIAGVGTSSDLA